MNPQPSTGLPARKPAQRQSTHSVALCSVNRILIQRVVASLEAGHAERNIADAEGISERLVRVIRRAELDRRNRQVNAVGVAFGGMLDNIRHLHREIDESFVAELREGAA